jgi:hypothetical protein
LDEAAVDHDLVIADSPFYKVPNEANFAQASYNQLP